jgi:orotate phosphoribosyltransferase
MQPTALQRRADPDESAGGPSAQPELLVRLVQRIAEICIVHVSETQRIISPSGGRQDWLIDLRRLFAKADALEDLAAAFFARFGSESIFRLAAIESAAIPLATAIALEGRRRGKAISVAYVRKERKTTGLGRNIEGDVPAGPAILVDDILNNGQSAEKARLTLEQAGVRLRAMFVVVDFRSANGLAWRKQHDVEVRSLFTPQDFGLKRRHPRQPARTRSYRLLWRFQAPGASPYHVVPKSTPLLVDDLLYFGSDSGAFWALDTATGKPAWVFRSRTDHPKGIWSSPAHHAGRVFFGTYNGDVHCLDAKTGREIWSHRICEWVGSSPLILPEHGLLAIGLEYARPRAGGSVCALSLETGEKVWEHWLRVVQHGSAAHWRGSDLVIFGTNDHSVIALKAKTGEVVWRFDTRRSVKYAPAVDEEHGLVSFASFDGSIYILKVETGEKVAEFPTGNICYTTPLFAHGHLFCGSGDRHMYVINVEAMTIVLKLDCGARTYSSPRLIRGSIFFGCNSGIVRELDPVSLEISGELAVADAVTNAVTSSIDGDDIFVQTYMNEIYAIARN